jgi:tyrosinase
VNVEVQVNNSVSPTARFIGWAPAPCRIRVTNPSGATGPTVNVRIVGVSTAGGGEVVFRRNTTGPFTNDITLPVPTNGASVSFFVAGKNQRPSRNAGDVQIEARDGATVVGSVPMMVRVRKNANTMSAAERDRFVSAMAQLNNQGTGRFTDFRDMHVAVSLPQAHGAPGFLPWHRAYLLDLERELQAIDPSVALPYWRFDQPAPNVFTRDFMGVPNAQGTLEFSASNPLQFWVTADGVPGINRDPLFDTNSAPPGLRTQAQTLALGSNYQQFRTMEGNPHGSAHVSFVGPIRNPARAPQDPLFFLLHCNVDRLWAQWQRDNSRFDPAVAASYDSSSSNPIGHNLPDTMWPWNGITGDGTPGSRPPTAPGGALAASPCVSAPGPQPQVRQSLDYQGVVNPVSYLGFDYEDIPFV